MAKTLACPKCKKAIVIEQAVTSAGSVTCGSCGSTFKLGKRSSEPTAPAATVSARPIARPVEPAPEDAFAGAGLGGLDLSSMNFDNMAMPTDHDPLGVAGDPLAIAPDSDPWVGAAPVPSGSYAPPTVQKPAPTKTSLSPKSITLIAVGSFVGMLLLSCGLGGLFVVRTVWNSNEDKNRMRLVALGMLNYESAYKRLPTPVVKNSEGKSVYSWTVTVLPYVEPPAELINFDQNKLLAWDAPGNEALRGPAPLAFRSARAGSKSDHRNVFVMSTRDIRDQAAPVFKEGDWGRISSIVDGTQKTIFAIQFIRYSRPWAEPGELSIDEAHQIIGKEPSPVLAVLGDGQIIWIPTDIDAAKYRAMATAAAADQW